MTEPSGGPRSVRFAATAFALLCGLSAIGYVAGRSVDCGSAPSTPEEKLRALVGPDATLVIRTMNGGLREARVERDEGEGSTCFLLADALACSDEPGALGRFVRAVPLEQRSALGADEWVKIVRGLDGLDCVAPAPCARSASVPAPVLADLRAPVVRATPGKAVEIELDLAQNARSEGAFVLVRRRMVIEPGGLLTRDDRTLWSRAEERARARAAEPRVAPSDASPSDARASDAARADTRP